VDIIAKEGLKLIRSTIPTTIEIRECIESQSLVFGNPSQIHQLFMNLCTNAAQAMEDAGGVLEVGLTDVELGASSSLPLSELKPGSYLKTSVSDTGPGIPPSIIGSIFDPYFTTKGPGEGTGMGLATVHGIVEAYGGKITVDSEGGKRTVFSVYLPITKKREDHQSYVAEELPSGSERVLFVDDELPIAKMGSQLLARLGYRVTVRTSSVEALELFQAKSTDFDLVITDMTMPNMNGDKLALELMKIRPDIPVILCTGYSKIVSDGSAAKIGIKAFAYKPIVKADLAKTVRKVLDAGRSEA
jgi:CheY-like chemotaxis protein